MTEPHGRAYEVAVNVLANLLTAGIVFGVVRLAGAPWWAAWGFGFVTYLLPTGRPERPVVKRGRR